MEKHPLFWGMVGQVYCQLVGTAMWTKMAPSYANLFMDRFERGFLDSEPTRLLVWLRYIDDIFVSGLTPDNP